jgi:hypothetical protein
MRECDYISHIGVESNMDKYLLEVCWILIVGL